MKSRNKIALFSMAAISAVFASVTAQAAWQPGLFGGSITGDNTVNTFAFPATTNLYQHPHAAASTASPPWAGNTTWVYWGQIYLDGSTYAFAENIDDEVWLKIDGVVLLNDTGADSWNRVTFNTITRPSV